ncbi:MAG: PspC domain-containing protein, partial [Candidatus Pacebacteria bacterium]|nr:PspC domain-containing protein [Candidatus Paceibacterota bacterium]
MSNNIKRHYRSKDNRMIFGVCGGLGEYFEIDPLIVRILFILLSLTGGTGIVLYFV